MKTTRGREWRDAAILKLPIIGGIFRRFAITQFTRSLATLLGGGTPLVPALENAADAIGNRAVSRRVREVVPRVREGRELWKTLEETGIFTDLTIEMIKVGESSGALEEMLSSVSEFYDEEIDLLLARVISFVEPAILVVMGGVIVTILLSVYLPDVPPDVGDQVVRPDGEADVQRKVGRGSRHASPRGPRRRRRRSRCPSGWDFRSWTSRPSASTPSSSGRFPSSGCCATASCPSRRPRRR